MALDFRREWSTAEIGISSDQRSATLTWNVTGATTPEEVRASAELPAQLNDDYPDNSTLNLKVKGIRITTLGKAYHRVTVNWEVPPDGSQHTGGGTQDNPLAIPTTFEWDQTHYSMPFDTEVNDNKPIVNSAGEAFDDHPVRELTAIAVTLVKNQTSFDSLLALAYGNTVNADGFLGADAGEVRCLAIRPTHVFTLSAQYVTVAGSFEFRSTDVWGDDPHQLQIKDQGYRAWYLTTTGESGVGNLVSSSSHEPPRAPVALNGKGKPIDSKAWRVNHDAFLTFTEGPPPDGSYSVEAPGGKAVYLRYAKHPARSFAALRSLFSVT